MQNKVFEVLAELDGIQTIHYGSPSNCHFHNDLHSTMKITAYWEAPLKQVMFLCDACFNQDYFPNWRSNNDSHSYSEERIVK